MTPSKSKTTSDMSFIELTPCLPAPATMLVFIISARPLPNSRADDVQEPGQHYGRESLEPSDNPPNVPQVVGPVDGDSCRMAKGKRHRASRHVGDGVSCRKRVSPEAADIANQVYGRHDRQAGVQELREQPCNVPRMPVPINDIEAHRLKLVHLVVAPDLLKPGLRRGMFPRLHGDVEVLPCSPPGRPAPRAPEIREVIARAPPSAPPAPKIVRAGDAHYALIISVAVEHLFAETEERRIGHAVVIEQDGSFGFSEHSVEAARGAGTTPQVHFRDIHRQVAGPVDF